MKKEIFMLNLSTSMSSRVRTSVSRTLYALEKEVWKLSLSKITISTKQDSVEPVTAPVIHSYIRGLNRDLKGPELPFVPKAGTELALLHPICGFTGMEGWPSGTELYNKNLQPTVQNVFLYRVWGFPLIAVSDSILFPGFCFKGSHAVCAWFTRLCWHDT